MFRLYFFSASVMAVTAPSRFSCPFSAWDSLSFSFRYFVASIPLTSPHPSP
nr:MAG TPA: hypothetical protein [Caudoviricetes sp.]